MFTGSKKKKKKKQKANAATANIEATENEGDVSDLAACPPTVTVSSKDLSPDDPSGVLLDDPGEDFFECNSFVTWIGSVVYWSDYL